MKYKVKMPIEAGWYMSYDWVVWLRENMGIGRATWAATKKDPNERYQFKFLTKNKKRYILLYFKNKEDAVLFKLIWV